MIFTNDTDEDAIIYLKPPTPRHTLRPLCIVSARATFDGPECYEGRLLVEFRAYARTVLTLRDTRKLSSCDECDGTYNPHCGDCRRLHP